MLALVDDIGTMLALVVEVVTMPLVLLVSEDILSLLLVKAMVALNKEVAESRLVV